VVCVTHEDALAYAAWRGQREGQRYRLPSAAEWPLLAQGAVADCSAARLACDRREGTVPVGGGKATPLGLSDVGGNTREWLAGGAQAGGPGWRTPPAQAQAAALQAVQDPRGADDLGFRLVRDVSLAELLGEPAARAR
jgi:formylglycine-generating enzyme required for sulfatase activity